MKYRTIVSDASQTTAVTMSVTEMSYTSATSSNIAVITMDVDPAAQLAHAKWIRTKLAREAERRKWR